MDETIDDEYLKTQAPLTDHTKCRIMTSYVHKQNFHVQFDCVCMSSYNWNWQCPCQVFATIYVVLLCLYISISYVVLLKS